MTSLLILLLSLFFMTTIDAGRDRDRSGSDRRSSDRPNLYYYNRYQPLTSSPTKYYPGWYGSEPEAHQAQGGQRVYRR